MSRNFNLKGTFVNLRVSFSSDQNGDEITVEQVEKGEEPIAIFFARFRGIEEMLEDAYEAAYEDFCADEEEGGTNH